MPPATLLLNTSFCTTHAKTHLEAGGQQQGQREYAPPPAAHAAVPPPPTAATLQQWRGQLQRQQSQWQLQERGQHVVGGLEWLMLDAAAQHEHALVQLERLQLPPGANALINVLRHQQQQQQLVADAALLQLQFNHLREVEHQQGETEGVEALQFVALQQHLTLVAATAQQQQQQQQSQPQQQQQ